MVSSLRHIHIFLKALCATHYSSQQLLISIWIPQAPFCHFATVAIPDLHGYINKIWCLQESGKVHNLHTHSCIGKLGCSLWGGMPGGRIPARLSSWQSSNQEELCFLIWGSRCPRRFFCAVPYVWSLVVSSNTLCYNPLECAYYGSTVALCQPKITQV